MCGFLRCRSIGKGDGDADVLVSLSIGEGVGVAVCADVCRRIAEVGGWVALPQVGSSDEWVGQAIGVGQRAWASCESCRVMRLPLMAGAPSASRLASLVICSVMADVRVSSVPRPSVKVTVTRMYWSASASVRV